MPTREYHCTKCGYDFKRLVFRGDDEKSPNCPKCGSPDIENIKAAAGLFNGISGHSSLAGDFN